MSKSSTTMAKSGLLRNPHPGEILLEEFLKPMGLSQKMGWRGLFTSRRVASTRLRCASATSRPIPTFGWRAISGYPKDFFLGLQMDYDLMQRRREIDRDLKAIRPRAA